MPPNEPTPSDRAPSAPFVIPPPPPLPGRSRRLRARGATVWTAVGIVLASAVQWFLSSRGAPAPVVDEAARAIQNALPK